MTAMSTLPYQARGMESSPGLAIPVTVAKLKKLFPLRDLDEDVLEAFAVDRRSERHSAGAILARRGQESDGLLYLLDGATLVEPAGRAPYRVESDTTRAHFPLCGGQEDGSAVVALSDVQVLRVCPRIMAQQGATHGVMADTDQSDVLPASLRSSRLFQSFCQNQSDRGCEVLPIPEVALHVQELCDRKADRRELGRVVAWDPVLSAKLVSQANSPLYYPEAPIGNCHEAVLRIGSNAAQGLIKRCCARRASRYLNPATRQLLNRFWRTSLLRGAICQLLAMDGDAVDPNQARLAGLIADIGELPYLQFADGFPAKYWNPHELEQVLPHIRAALGAKLLSRWNFPGDLVDAALFSRNWHQESGTELTLTDLVVVANLLIPGEDSRHAPRPAVDAIPAWNKVDRGGLTPRRATQVLQKARAMLNSMNLPELVAPSAANKVH